jgi:hypothetical protein
MIDCRINEMKEAWCGRERDEQAKSFQPYPRAARIVEE